MQKNRLKLFSGDNNESKGKHTNKMNGTIETSIVRIKHTDEKKKFLSLKSVKEEEYIKSVTIYFFLSSFCVCVGIVIICLSVDDENEG